MGGAPGPHLPRRALHGRHEERTFHPRPVQRAFARALKAAEFPIHFTPHGLRHTFASVLLSDGVSPAYVQRMLGHSSIRMTVDLYGQWLR